jgi:hypothetical protein
MIDASRVEERPGVGIYRPADVAEDEVLGMSIGGLIIGPPTPWRGIAANATGSPRCAPAGRLRW